MSTLPLPGPLPSRHMLVRLQHDWDHVKRSRHAIDHARRWALSCHAGTGRPLDTLDDVLHCCGYGHSSAVDGDRVLAELVRLAADDQLAARVVLQRLLPGISAVARRRVTVGRPHRVLLDEALAVAWTVIRTYPVDRRRTFVAVGMLREIDYHAFRRQHRRQTTFVPRPQHTFDLQPAPVAAEDAAVELSELLDAAVAVGVGAQEVDLARRLGRGDSTREIAAALRVTDRTVRNRRDTVTYQLRAVAAATGRGGVG